MSAAPPLVGIAGWSGSGKTTLIVRLLADLGARGVRVGVIKHAHHGLREPDGTTDGERHAAAGAAGVAVIAPDAWEISGERQATAPPDLAGAAAALGSVDLVLVEGFKSAPIPKIEVRRSATSTQQPLAPTDPHVIAIAADYRIADAALPVFDLDDVEAIAEFILDTVKAR